MIAVPLQCWNFPRLGLRLNPNRGTGRLMLLCENTRGEAYRFRGQWHALWNDNGRLCLQIGGQKWYAEEGWIASLREIGKYRVFELSKGQKKAITLQYRNPNERWWNKIDATRDDLDDLMSDFFLWVARVWSDRDSHRAFVQGAWKRHGPKLTIIPGGYSSRS